MPPPPPSRGRTRPKSRPGWSSTLGIRSRCGGRPARSTSGLLLAPAHPHSSRACDAAPPPCLPPPTRCRRSYAAKAWGGLVSSYYKPRWALFTKTVLASLAPGMQRPRPLADPAWPACLRLRRCVPPAAAPLHCRCLRPAPPLNRGRGLLHRGGAVLASSLRGGGDSRRRDCHLMAPPSPLYI